MLARSLVVAFAVFAIAHGYDLLGQATVAAFATVAGWLAIRTGGLEAAIGLHVMNNLAVFGLGALALGDVTRASQGSRLA